jgi:hypothetical protein|tara:strand:+ start:10163 stop:10291 length:129 start_codon:yes stop_codon:yes gene_type:complete
MNNTSYILEAFLLGTLIYFGLSNIDINININEPSTLVHEVIE